MERVALERGEAVEVFALLRLIYRLLKNSKCDGQTSLVQVEELLSALQRYQELKASVAKLGQKREKRILQLGSYFLF